MLQIRMTIFNSLLLVGYYIAALAFYFALKNDANMFRVGWALCLPLISIILNILAVRAIGRDEVTVSYTHLASSSAIRLVSVVTSTRSSFSMQSWISSIKSSI